MIGGSADRGHRVLPHTADVRLEAWGPDFCACVAEAVLALVGVFADISGAPDGAPASVAFDGDRYDELLLEALDEVIYRLDVDGAVPVAVRLARTGSRLEGEYDLVPLEQVEAIGPEPKALARSDLEVTTVADHTVTARVTVDV